MDDILLEGNDPPGWSRDAFLRKLYRLKDIDAFALFVMKELPPLVASDATAYTEINTLRRRTFSVIDTPEGQRVLEARTPQFEAYINQHPLIRHFEKNPDDGPRKVTDFLTVDAWKKTDIYQQFYRYFDLNYQMVIIMPATPPNVVGVVLNRRDRDFDEDDRRILATLQPHLTQAYRNVIDRTTLHTRAEITERALEILGGGVVTVNDSLDIVSVSDLADQSIKDFFPAHPVDGKRLPATIEDWLNGNRQKGTATPMRLETDAGRLTLRLWDDEQDGLHMIVLERFTPEQSSHPLRDLGLTTREADVLYWVAQGKSNPEIAIIHGLSVQTIKKQVETVLKKLRVGNRTAAAVKAFEHLRSR